MSHSVYVECPSIAVVAGGRLGLRNVTFAATRSTVFEGESAKLGAVFAKNGRVDAENVRFQDLRLPGYSAIYGVGANVELRDVSITNVNSTYSAGILLWWGSTLKATNLYCRHLRTLQYFGGCVTVFGESFSTGKPRTNCASTLDPLSSIVSSIFYRLLYLDYNYSRSSIFYVST